jgi:DNA-binding response OmpR family regulator
MAEQILVVDDDLQLTSFLDRFLTKQGFSVTCAATATQMGLMMEHAEYDLIVLDIGLPDGDGLEVMREIRRSSEMPIVVLSARDEVFDRVIGLELGADDYLTKPFEPRELLARIKSVLRRTRTPGVPDQKEAEVRRRNFAGFSLDLIARTLSRMEDGSTVPLTSTEYALLLALSERPGQVLNRAIIVGSVYGHSTAITDRAVDAHVARLRRKIDQGDTDTSLIQTVHGVGYTLASAVNFE